MAYDFLFSFLLWICLLVRSCKSHSKCLHLDVSNCEISYQSFSCFFRQNIIFSKFWHTLATKRSRPIWRIYLFVPEESISERWPILLTTLFINIVFVNHLPIFTLSFKFILFSQFLNFPYMIPYSYKHVWYHWFSIPYYGL